MPDRRLPKPSGARTPLALCLTPRGDMPDMPPSVPQPDPAGDLTLAAGALRQLRAILLHAAAPRDWAVRTTDALELVERARRGMSDAESYPLRRPDDR